MLTSLPADPPPTASGRRPSTSILASPAPTGKRWAKGLYGYAKQHPNITTVTHFIIFSRYDSDVYREFVCVINEHHAENTTLS
jgi:hypothetical protein